MNENDREITALVMVAHAMVHTYELSLPVLLGIWQSQFEAIHLPLVGSFPATPFVMGVVLTVGYAPFGLGALPGGVLSDAYGSRTLIAACMAGMAGAFLALAASPSLAAVGLSLFVWGIAASVYHPAGLSLISTGVRARGRAFAYHGIAGNLGIALGPFATAVLLFALTGWRVVVAMLALPALLGAALALHVDVDETAAVASDRGAGSAVPTAADASLNGKTYHHGDTPAHEPAAADASTADPSAADVSAIDRSADTSDGDAPTAASATGSVSSLPEFLSDSRRLFGGAFVLVFVIVVCSGLYYRGILTFLPEILDQVPSLPEVRFAERDLEPERYVYAGFLMVGVLGQYAGGMLTDRVPVELGLAGGFGVLAVLALLFVQVASAGLGSLLVVGALVGFFLFAVQPQYQATVAEYTPPGARGVSYGYTYLGVFGIGAVGGLLAGGFLTYFDEIALFGGLATIAGFAAILAVVLFGRRR